MEVLSQSQLQSVVQSVSQSQYTSKKALAKALRSRYIGLSKGIQSKMLPKRKLKRPRNTEDTPPQADNSQPTITAELDGPIRPMQQIWLKLVNFNTESSYDNSGAFTIILVLEAFCGFMWIRPFRKRCEKLLERELLNIFDVFGYPDTLYHGEDELLSRSDILSNVLDVRLIGEDSPGRTELEEAERNLKSLIQLDDDNSNYMENLHFYQNDLNDLPKTSYGLKTPFELFFGRKKHNARQRSICQPSKKARRDHFLSMSQTISLDSLHNTTVFEDKFGIDIYYNPNGDGNCMFEALVKGYCGEPMGSGQLRQYITDYLKAQEYLGFQHETPWHDSITESKDEYLNRMSQPGTYGDHITLQAFAELFNIQILVCSTLDGGTRLLTPTSSQLYNPGSRTILLGHYAEGEGEHYVLLQTDETTIKRVLDRSPNITALKEDTLIVSGNEAASDN